MTGVAWSDQLSFWRQGYSALMVTDTAFHRYAYYHTALDTPEKLNYEAHGQGRRGFAECLRCRLLIPRLRAREAIGQVGLSTIEWVAV
jgi:hypothetical protein